MSGEERELKEGRGGDALSAKARSLFLWTMTANKRHKADVTRSGWMSVNA